MNTNKLKHTNKQHSKQTLLNPNGAIEARVGGRETKMVRAVGTDAFTVRVATAGEAARKAPGWAGRLLVLDFGMLMRKR